MQKFYFHSIKVLFLLKKGSTNLNKTKSIKHQQKVGSPISSKRKIKEFVNNKLIIVKVQVFIRINVCGII